MGSPPENSEASADAENLIPADVAAGHKSGYNFTMAATTSGYEVNAEPKVYDVTGSRSFYTDATILIREHRGEGPASHADPELE